MSRELLEKVFAQDERHPSRSRRTGGCDSGGRQGLPRTARAEAAGAPGKGTRTGFLNTPARELRAKQREAPGGPSK